MAEWREIEDDDGNTLKCWYYDGEYHLTLFVGNVKDHLEDMKNMEVRDDDVFISTFPKSGTHWAYQIAHMLTHKNTEYPGSPTFIEYKPMSEINEMPSPRFFASHLLHKHLPLKTREGKGKIILVHRNIKDVSVSFYQFIQTLKHSDFVGSWEGFLKFFLEGTLPFGSWFDYMDHWDKAEKSCSNILCVHYEDMKQDLLGHVIKIAHFLGVSREQKFLEEVADRCTYKNMSKSEMQPHEQWKTIRDDLKVKIYRKGEVGDWKNWFTVAQNEMVDKLYTERMKNSSRTFRFT